MNGDPTAALPLIRAVTRWASSVSGQESLWTTTIGDVGRQYAWPWWNTLLARPALARFGGAAPGVAATADVWSLMGRVPAAGPVPWLVGVHTVTRQPAPAGPPVPPGDPIPAGRRLRQLSQVERFAAAQVWIEATDRAAPVPAEELVASIRDAARGWSVLVPAAAQPFEALQRLARTMTEFDVDDTTPAPLVEGLPIVGPPSGELVATCAAWALIAAHGLSAVFLPAGTPAATAAAMAAAVEGGDWTERAAHGVRTLHAVAQTLQQLLAAVGRPAWNGGLLTVASTGGQGLPAPRLPIL